MIAAPEERVSALEIKPLTLKILLGKCGHMTRITGNILSTLVLGKLMLVVTSVLLGGAAIVIGWWLVMKSRPATKCVAVVAETQGDNWKTWNLKVENPRFRLVPRRDDVDVTITVRVEKITGSEPKSFRGVWFSKPTHYQGYIGALMSGQGVSTAYKAIFREGVPQYTPIVYKRLNINTVTLCEGSTDDSGQLIERTLPIGSYAVHVELNVTGGPRTEWFLLHNKDRQTATLNMYGPFDSFKKTQAKARRLGLM